MKKFILFMISAILLVTMLIPAFAAGIAPATADTETLTASASPTLYMTSSTAKAGQELELDVCVKNNPGIAAIAMKITYPTDALELVGFTAGMLMNMESDSVLNGRVLLESKNPKVDMTEDGTLVTVKFKVKDGAEAKDYTVSISEEDFSAGKASGKDYVTFEKQSGTVKVTEALAVNNVFVDDGKNFNVGRLYYKNGDAKDNFTGSASDYNAHYDPETNILTLKDYNGGRISIGGVVKADITIELIGTNTVTGSVRTNTGGDITILGTGSLKIDATYSGDAYGIEAGFSGAFATGNVTITGKADVTINSLNNANTGNAYGIFAKQSITISESASVNITCKTPSNTWRASTCYGLFVPGSTSGGRVTIDTDGTIAIDVKDAGADAYGYGVYASNYTLTKVGNMTAEWKKTTTGGHAFYRLESFSSATHAINIDTTNGYASYRYGTPYTVTVKNGSFTGTGVKYEKYGVGNFLAGDEITLTTPVRYADDAKTIEIPFVKWVSGDVTVANAASQSGATFTMPGKNVAVTANYNPFVTQPKFTQVSNNQGTVSVKLVGGAFSSLRIYSASDLESTKTYGSYTSTSLTEKVFTVYSSSCLPGQYVVAVSYNGTTYYSEPFTVDYSETHPTKPTINVTGTYTYNGADQTATVTGFDSATMTITGNVGKNAGEYTISVTSKTGKWADGTTGAVTVKWTIAKANPTVTTPTGLTGTKGKALSTVTLPSGWTWKAPATVMNTTGNQSFAAVYTPSDTANYNTKEVNLTVVVSEPPVTHPTKPTINVTGTYTYNGADQTATVTGFDSATMTITGNVGKNAGEYTISVTSKTGKWADGTTGAVTVKWTIAKANPTVTAPTGLTGTKGKALSTVTLPSGWTWKAPATVMNTTGNQSFAAVYTPSDTANYNTKEVNLTVVVSEPPVTHPAKPTLGVSGSYTYTGSDITATITGFDSATMTITGNVGKNAGEYTISVTSKTGKWADGTTGAVTVKWTIAKANPTVTAPTGLTGTKGKALSTVTLPSGWTWKAPATVMNTTGNQSFAAVYTPSDTANYNTKEVNLTVVVSEPPVTHPAKPTINVTGTYTYNGADQTATITGFDSATMTITGNVGKNAGEYTISVTSKTGKWADGTTGAVTVKWTIAVKKVSIPIIEVRGTYLYTGAAIIPNYRVWDEDYFNTIPADEYDISVTDNINAGIGKITITNKKNKENGNYEIGTAVQTFTIGKGTQEKPTGIIGIAPTGSDTSDGKITGVTTAMEYRKAGATTWTKVTGSEIAGLAAGNYEVRLAETTNLEASDIVTVIVAVHTHSFGTEWKHDGTNHWHECACGEKSANAAHTGGTATCKEKATCSVCGEKYGDIAAHSFGAWMEEEPATTEKEGVKAHKDCTVCGKHFDRDGVEMTDITIDKLPGQNKPDDPTNPPAEKDGLSGGAIAGIVIASVVVVGVGGFAIVWFVIKKKTFASLIAACKARFKRN